MNETLILSTTDSLELARKISSALVDSREAACVSIIPGITSIYRWEGKVHEEGEYLLLIKTTSEKFEAVRKIVRELHTYQLPELISIPIVAGDPEYMNWLRSS